MRATAVCTCHLRYKVRAPPCASQRFALAAPAPNAIRDPYQFYIPHINWRLFKYLGDGFS